MAVANPYMSAMQHDTIDAGIESPASVKPESNSGSSSYTNDSSNDTASPPGSSHSGTPGPTSAPDRVNGSRKYKSRPIWATKAESQSPPIAPRTRAESPDWTNAPSPPSPQGDHGSSSTVGSDDAKSSELSTSPNSDKEQHKHDPYSKIYSSAQRASTSVPAWARTATSTTAEDGSTSASASSNGGTSADAAAAAAATASSMRKDSQSSEERERAGARQLYDKLRDNLKRPFSRVSGLTWSETADKFHPDMRPRKTANHEARMKKQRLEPSLFPREDSTPGFSSTGSLAIKKEPLDTRYDIPRSSYATAPGIKQDPISLISPDEENFNRAELDRNDPLTSGAMRNKPATEEERRLAEYNRLFGGILADAEPTPTVQTDEPAIPPTTTTAPAARGGRQPRIKTTDETLSAHLVKFSTALASVSALRGQITTTLRDYAAKIQDMERAKRAQDAEIQTLTHQGRLNEHKIQGLETANARLAARMEAMERMVARGGLGVGGGAAAPAFASAATPATAIVLDDDDEDVVVSERIGSLGSSDLESLFGRSGSDSNGVKGGLVAGLISGTDGSGDGALHSFEDMFPVA